MKTNKALLDSQSEALLKLYDAMNEERDNFVQKIKVVGLRVAEGKPKTDKEGNIITNDFGEVEKWDNKYYLTFLSLGSGGTHTTAVGQEVYESLKLNETYIAEGKVEYRVFGDNYNSTPIIVFDKFTTERDELLKSLANFKVSENASEA